MLARVQTFTINGIDSQPVAVEMDVQSGLPAFSVGGMVDAAVREARERVRSAIQNSGYDFPLRRIIANLAPAALRKVGPGFDLAIAVALLAASSQVELGEYYEYAFYGELSLTGAVRSTRGALAVAEGARNAGLRGVILPAENVPEASLVEGLDIVGIESLAHIGEFIRGERAGISADVTIGSTVEQDSGEVDLADVRGQAASISALCIAAAGGHNLLLQGAPGVGKTMLARRLPTVLPPLTAAEAVEVTRIHSIAGSYDGSGLMSARPFRSPHHTISAPGLVGGGAQPTPGEATMAHRGVLFLDELSEFERRSLEALRQPLEDGRVVIVRGQHGLVFPTQFMLVASCNPCPCGMAGVEGGSCNCLATDLARHRRRLSGPLLDRIDLLIDVQRPSSKELVAPAVTTSAIVRAQVESARSRQRARLIGTAATCNAQMDGHLLQTVVKVDTDAQTALQRAYAAGKLSARGHGRVLRVAQTIADLAGRDRVARVDVLQALTLRQLDLGVNSVAA